jgi:hypothetical protein
MCNTVVQCRNDTHRIALLTLTPVSLRFPSHEEWNYEYLCSLLLQRVFSRAVLPLRRLVNFGSRIIYIYIYKYINVFVNLSDLSSSRQDDTSVPIC